MPTLPSFLLHVPYVYGYCGGADNGKRFASRSNPHQESAMGHAVMTHTQNQATVNYAALPQDTQNLFDQLMDQADNTANSTEYTALMTALIGITGLTDVRHGEILKCACGCDCPVIFDADNPAALVTETPTGYNLGRLQCPDCADDHPQPVQD